VCTYRVKEAGSRRSGAACLGDEHGGCTIWHRGDADGRNDEGSSLLSYNPGDGLVGLWWRWLLEHEHKASFFNFASGWRGTRSRFVPLAL
jgi:hypothetical protein